LSSAANRKKIKTPNEAEFFSHGLTLMNRITRKEAIDRTATGDVIRDGNGKIVGKNR
jgi:hypothetical protein